MENIKGYNDIIFEEYSGILRNAFIFKTLNPETLQKISYLFR